MQHKKKVVEKSATLGKGVLFLLLFSVGATLFFSTYLILKKNRIEALRTKKVLLQKKYEEVRKDQKDGMLALFMASELNGWKSTSPTVLNQIKAFATMPADLKLDFYSSDASILYRMLPEEDQNEFFKYAFLLMRTTSAGFVDSGTKKGKYAFPSFLVQINNMLKNPFELEPTEPPNEDDETIPFEGWAISTADEKEWVWKSVAKPIGSNLQKNTNHSTDIK